MSQLQPMTRRDVDVKCIPVKRIPSCLHSAHVQYVCKMRAAYLRHYPPMTATYLYINNLRMECIKLPTTHLRNSVSEIIAKGFKSFCLFFLDAFSFPVSSCLLSSSTSSPDPSWCLECRHLRLMALSSIHSSIWVRFFSIPLICT